MTAIMTSTTASMPTDASSGLVSDIIPMSGEFRTVSRMSDGTTDLFSRQLNSLWDGNPVGATITSAATTAQVGRNAADATGAGPHVAEQSGSGRAKLFSDRGQVERSDLPVGLSGSVTNGTSVVPDLALQTNIAVKSPAEAYSDTETSATQTDAVDDEAAGRTEVAMPRHSRLQGLDKSFGDRRVASSHVGREDRGGDDGTTSDASAVVSTSPSLAGTTIPTHGIVVEGASRPGSSPAIEGSAMTDARGPDRAAVTNDVQSSSAATTTDGLAAQNTLPSQITDPPAVEAAIYRSAMDQVQAGTVAPGGPATLEPSDATAVRPTGQKASGRPHSGQAAAGSDNSMSLSDQIQVFISPAAAAGPTAMSADGDGSTTPRSLARLSLAEGLASKTDSGDVQSFHRGDAVDPTEAPGLTSIPNMPGDPVNGIPGGSPAAAAGGSAVMPDGVKGLVAEPQASLAAAADHEDAQAAAGQVSASLMTMAAGTSRFSQLAVSLQPKDLGSVRIQLDRRADGRVSIVVAATDPATLRRLMTDQEHLHAALNAASIPAADRQLTFELASPHAIAPTGPDGSADRASVSSGGMQMPTGDAGLSQRQSQDQASRDDRGGGWRQTTDAGSGLLTTTSAAFLPWSNSSARPAMLRGINITA